MEASPVRGPFQASATWQAQPPIEPTLGPPIEPDVFAPASLARDEATAPAPLDQAARLRRRAARNVGLPWLAGRALPLAREAVLPPWLLVDIDTRRVFAGRAATLAGLAPRLARISGVAVRVLPDAELPAALFLPRLAGMPAAVNPDSGKPGGPPAPRAHPGGGILPLPQLLDELAAQWGVYWRHRGGAIEFYRTETRVFALARPSLAAHTDIRYESANAGGLPQSTVKTRLSDSEAQSLDDMRVRIESLLSRAGVATVQPGAEPAVVVTDIPPALARVAAFLADSNHSATRRVRLVFDEIAWSDARASAVGVDWNALHRAVAGDSGLTGAEAVIAMLRRTGAILRHRSIPVVTLNHRPVTHVLRAVVAGAWPRQPARAAAGSLLTLVPDIQQDGRILVSVAYDGTAAPTLAHMAPGSASGAGHVVAGGGTVQQLALSPSRALIIAGSDQAASPESASAGIGSLLILTASLEEGTVPPRQPSGASRDYPL
jgi:hypothetical protein